MSTNNWRWNPLHSEHMVPGSFWKLRDETALYYLEDPIAIDVMRNGGFVIGPAANMHKYECDFELEKAYFLTKIEEQDGNYVVTFLDDARCIETKVVKGCWDNVFELVKGSNYPKPGPKLLFGRITFEEILSKYGK